MAGATFTLLIQDLVNANWHPPLDNYPIFDPTYRQPLNAKIIRHYAMREIGWETVELFEYALETKMGEIMPLYNQLYLSSQLAFDPMKTMSFTDVMTGSLNITGHGTEDTTSDTNTTSATDSSVKSRVVGSDTPQTRLAGDEDYASGMSDTVSSSNATATSDAKGNAAVTSDHTNDQAQNTNRTFDGYSGVSPSKLLRDFREQIINIDMMVINDLEPLFMSVYDNGDSFTDVTVPGSPVGFGGTITPSFSFPYYF